MDARPREGDPAEHRMVQEGAEVGGESSLTIVDNAVNFHGHLGPYVVLGVRMGLLAKARLGFHGHFDGKVKAYVGEGPPVSCLADGLQVSTGATLGKGNIEIGPLEGGPPRATFEAGGRTIEIALTGRVLELTESLDGREAAAEAGREVISMADEDLFVLRETGSLE